MRRRPRRHPLAVTADRLAHHHERYHHLLDGRMLDDISHIIDTFERIAEGEATG